MTRQNGVNGVLARTEKDEMRAGDSLIRHLGGDIVSFAQPRNTMQTAGIPDRRYRYRSVVFWFEVKAENGRLTREQFKFLKAEHDCGQVVGAGGLDELRLIIDEIRRDNLGLRAWGWQTVQWVANRGFRGEPRPKHGAETAMREHAHG